MNTNTAIQRQPDRDWLLDCFTVEMNQKENFVVAIFCRRTRHCLALEVDRGPSHDLPVRAICHAIARHGAPQTITTSQSSQLYSTQFSQLAHQNGFTVIHRIPSDNPTRLSVSQFIELLHDSRDDHSELKARKDH